METSKSSGKSRRSPKRKRMSLHLMDDDVNSIENVINVLKNIIPMCNVLRAEQIAMLVHESGQCQIHEGFPPEIYLLYARLKKYGLTVQLKTYKK